MSDSRNDTTNDITNGATAAPVAAPTGVSTGIPADIPATPAAAQATHYETMGGEAAIRRIVDRFYDLMDSAPEAVNVRALHAHSLKASREKLFMFLTGWTGGPQLYIEKHGHPRLRMRHFPFAIASRERDEWLWCMDRALDEQPMPEELRETLRAKLHDVADHMRNQPDPGVLGLPVVGN